MTRKEILPQKELLRRLNMTEKEAICLPEKPTQRIIRRKLCINLFLQILGSIVFAPVVWSIKVDIIVSKFQF